MITVKSKRYQIKADQITCRTAKTYRKIKRKAKGQKVTVSVLTRDAGKTLRTASMRVTLRARR
jgi:hypothetical protein